MEHLQCEATVGPARLSSQQVNLAGFLWVCQAAGTSQDFHFHSQVISYGRLLLCKFLFQLLGLPL